MSSFWSQSVKYNKEAVADEKFSFVKNFTNEKFTNEKFTNEKFTETAFK